MRTLSSRGTQLQPIAFSPDSRLFVAAGASGSTAIFDLSTGHVRHEIKAKCEGARFSPDGKVLVIRDSDDDREDFWEVRPWRHMYHLDSADELAFSPDSREVALGTEGDTEIYRVATGRPLRDLQGYWQAVFSPDGRWIAASASKTYDGAYIMYQSHIDILDAKSLRRMRRYARWAQIEGMAFSSDSRQLAIVESAYFDNGYDIDLWDMRSGKARQLCDVNEHNQSGMHTLRFLNHDRLIEIKSEMGATYWDVKTGKAVDRIERNGEIFLDYGLLSPDGTLLAASADSPADDTGAIEIRRVDAFAHGARM